MQTNTNLVRRANKIEAMSYGRRVVLFTSLILMLGLVLLVIAELGVRTRMYVKYGTFWGFEVKAYDPDSGLHLPVPNYESGPVKINSLGFRSPELNRHQMPGGIRLAFLGGSTTFCQEVSSNDLVWSAVTTQELQQRFPDNQFDHINASATAYRVRESLVNFQHRVVEHDPDVVVIYHSVNDIASNGARLAKLNGYKVSTNSTAPWIRGVLEMSLLAELVYKNVLILLKRQEAETGVKVPFDRDYMTERFRVDLKMLVEDALQSAEMVVIPTFSNQLRSDQSPERQLEAASTHLFHIPFFKIEDLLQAFESYNQVIREFSVHERVLVVETEHVIEGSAENFVDSVHFSDTGSQRIGRYLAESLALSVEFRNMLDRREEIQ